MDIGTPLFRRPGFFETNETRITSRFCAVPESETVPPNCPADRYWERSWDLISVADLNGDGIGDRFYVKRNLRYLALQDTDGDGNLDKQLIWVDQEQLYYFERDERFNGEDVDADGVSNEEDAFPFDPTESVDTDGDGVGDNRDVFPESAADSVDTDGDGVGDNSDPDIDGDGIENVSVPSHSIRRVRGY